MNIQFCVNAYIDLNERARYFHETARCLAALQHNVRIAAWHMGGPMVEYARNCGVVVEQYRDATPWDAEIVHSENALATERAVERFPGVPIVRTVFGVSKTDRVFGNGIERAHIVTSPKLRDRIRTEAWVVPYPVNLEDLPTRLEADRRPRGVLWVGSYNKTTRAALDELVADRYREAYHLYIVGNAPAELAGDRVHILPARWDWFTLLGITDVVASPVGSHAALIGKAAGKETWQYGLTHGKVAYCNRDVHPMNMQKHSVRTVTQALLDIYRDTINTPARRAG